MYFNAPFGHIIGRGTAGGQNFDGNNSFMAFVDGQSLAPTSFGQVNSRTGEWRPKGKASVKAVVDAGGVTSFFLPFDDNTNTTTIVADASSKGNNWVANNISLTAGTTYDSMLDTPTDNFCTLNPLKAGIAPVNGNLALIGAGTHKGALGTMPLIPNSLIYFEGRPAVNNQRISLGVATEAQDVTTIAPQVSYRGIYGDSTYVSVYNGASLLYNLSAVVSTDVYQIAVDTVSGKGWFGRNNVWYDNASNTTGNPVTGVNPTWTGLTSSFFPLLGCYDPTNPVSINFGQQPFAYTPPIGYKTQSTKNLPVKYPVMKASLAVAAVLNTGANILSALSTAESWADYVRIVKRRDSAEGWRWMFSDDPANYLDSSSTAAKAAIPAFGGSSYVGYSLKVSAQNGVATGRLTHVNGVADVVTDGLASSRKMIFLKNEATGSWVVYHPDCTAGKLMYLEQTTLETVDATISAVTTSGFTVAAALASGTYRWLTLAEVDGFLKLFKYTGNGAADGTFSAGSGTPLFIMQKRTDAAGGWYNYDAVRDVGNPSGSPLYWYLNNAEAAFTATYDFVSNGIKNRRTGPDQNATGGVYVGFSINAFPFRYANAR